MAFILWIENPKGFIIIPVDNTKTTVIEYRSTKIDLPLVEGGAKEFEPEQAEAGS